MMTYAAKLRHIIRTDPLRWRLLELVRLRHLPDCWVGAGFVRNAVWDHLHSRSPSPLNGDVDVIWHDHANADQAVDKHHQGELQAAEPSVIWSVKNQARMHLRNGDAPYASSIDAMRHWPETATAVAVRRTEDDDCKIAAPFGLDDLFGLMLRPTPRFTRDRRDIFAERLRSKQWTLSWPMLVAPAVGTSSD
jgi:hypothetical protein